MYQRTRRRQGDARRGERRARRGGGAPGRGPRRASSRPRGRRLHGGPRAVRRHRHAAARAGGRVGGARHAADERRCRCDALRVAVDIPQSVVEQVRARRARPRSTSTAGASRPRAHDLPRGASRSRTPSARGSSCRRACGPLRPACSSRSGFVVGEAERLLVPRIGGRRSAARCAASTCVDADGRVALRQVRLGHARGDRVEVLAGLAAGERVALDPAAARAVKARRPAAQPHD